MIDSTRIAVLRTRLDRHDSISREVIAELLDAVERLQDALLMCDSPADDAVVVTTPAVFTELEEYKRRAENAERELANLRASVEAWKASHADTGTVFPSMSPRAVMRRRKEEE